MSESVVALVAKFVAASVFVTELQGLQSALHGAIKPLGFTGGCLFRVGNHHAYVDPDFLLGDECEAWMAHYRKHRYVEHDLAAAMCFWSPAPFTWSDVEKLSNRPGSRRLIADGRRLWAPEILVCPVHAGHGDVAAVVFTVDEVRDPSLTDRKLIQAIAGVYCSIGLQLLAAQAPERADANLTRRELECVYWVAMGKSDNEIARLSAISPNTVHHQIESAKRKLSVNSRVLLVRKAASAGLILPPRPHSSEK